MLLPYYPVKASCFSPRIGVGSCFALSYPLTEFLHTLRPSGQVGDGDTKRHSASEQFYKYHRSCGVPALEGVYGTVAIFRVRGDM
jgi:hypothetical protein